jgi:hypothetical protein
LLAILGLRPKPALFNLFARSTKFGRIEKSGFLALYLFSKPSCVG